MHELVFTTSCPFEVITAAEPCVLNFQNMYSLYLFHHEPVFRKALSRPQNVIFPDSRPLSLFLQVSQQRGPSFTKMFLTSPVARTKRHFFIGDAHVIALSKKTGIQKNRLKIYNPPYIQGVEFQEKEKALILHKIQTFKPDYVWVCIGNPKQEILANQLYDKYPECHYINVGAALDFLLGKRQEAPRFVQSLGIEWLYRLITDFNYTKKKVWKSFAALRYLQYIHLQE